jgi:hypothetical protein
MAQGKVSTKELILTQVDIDTVDLAPSGATKLVGGDDGNVYVVTPDGNKQAISPGPPGPPGETGVPGAAGPNQISTATDVSFAGSGVVGFAAGKATSIEATRLLQPVASSTSSFFVGSFNSIETGLPACFAAGGTASLPNRIGVASRPASTSFSAAWFVNDTAYVAGAAQVATIGGGYDHVNNQIAGTICGGGHNFIRYNASGHSVIVGGSFNTIQSGRGLIVAGSQNASLGNGNYQSVINGVNNVVEGGAVYATILNGDTNNLTGQRSTVFGDNNVVNGADCLVFGRRHSVTHAHNIVSGEDGRSLALWSTVNSRTQHREKGDNQTVSTVQSIVTTTNSVTNLANAMVLPAGKVVAVTGRVSVVAMRDGTAAGNNDGIYTSSHWEGPVGIRWDGTNGIIHDLAGSSALESSPNRNVPVIQDPLAVSQPPRFRINTGSLRLDVTGLAGVRITWVARLDLVVTIVS